VCDNGNNRDNSKNEASEARESAGDNGDNGKVAVLGNGHCKHVSKEEKLKC
jgi:hypothetical protein